MDELRALARKKEVPSVNHAILEAVSAYLKEKNEAMYEAAMREAARDKAFLARTAQCAEDFKHVDSEGLEEW
jgi:3-deoxy-D-arabino-heptulosonate 7-phosphate (DAHP) synthase class II